MDGIEVRHLRAPVAVVDGDGFTCAAAGRSTPWDEWLTVIAAGRAAGSTSEATAHPRPGIAYRPPHDAQPVAVRLLGRE